MEVKVAEANHTIPVTFEDTHIDSHIQQGRLT